MRRAGSGALLLSGTLLIGALLRFSSLGAKSYWGDEISTLFLIRRDFGSMLAGIARLESTPPLYYAVAKLWHGLAGDSEAAMRALPAAFGVAAIAVAYLAARELVSARAATVTAVLLAVNPMLVWYSSEARSYSLAVLLGASSLLFFARALHGRAHSLPYWAAASCLALATHYFSVFIVAPEAYILYRRATAKRGVLIALAPIAATGAALLPLAAYQASFGHTAWITHSLLPLRVLRAPLDLLVGFDAPLLFVIGPVVVLLASVGAHRAVKRVRAVREREGVTVATTVGLAALALPIAAGIAGADYFASRNVIEAIVPVTIVVAAGFASLRRGPALAVPVLLVTMSLSVVVATAREPKYHSEDWRAAAQALGADGSSGRAVIVTPGQAGRKPLMVYLGEGTRPAVQRVVRVAEIDLVVEPHQGSSSPALHDVRALAELRIKGFRLAAQHVAPRFDIFELRVAKPMAISPPALSTRLAALRPAVLLER